MFQTRPRIRTFFIATFAFTWGICAYLLFTTPPDILGNIRPSFIILAVICGLSPTIVAYILSMLSGTSKQLWAQLRIKFIGRLLAPALLLVPLMSILSYLPGNTISAQIPATTLIMGLTWPLFSSLGEEFGWRGFAFKTLYERKGFTYAAIVTGLVWGLWHLPMDYIGLRSHGWYFIPEFLLVGPALLTAHAIIMSYLYVKGNGNLWLTILYHYTITSSAIILPAFFGVNVSAPFDVANLVQPAILNLVLWAIALWILIKGDAKIFRQEKT